MSLLKEDIKFETVFDAIEHYKSERNRLEDTLRQLREKRSVLNDANAIAMAEQVNVVSRKAKTAETLQMVQHRVTQMQNQGNVLRESAECLQRHTRCLQVKVSYR